MAYTGTGTQADPYIVTEWDDLISLASTTCYIELGEDIDLTGVNINSLYRVSVVAYIDGRGHTIKNGYKNNSGEIFTVKSPDTNRRYWRNTKFENWYLTNSAGFMRTSMSSNDYTKPCTLFEYCDFSFELVATNNQATEFINYFSDNYSIYTYSRGLRFNYCNISIISKDGTPTGINSVMPPVFDHCRVHIDGSIRPAATQSPAVALLLLSSYVTGHISYCAKMTIDASCETKDVQCDSIVDLAIDECPSFNVNKTCSYNFSSPVVICNENWGNVSVSTVSASIATFCTKADLLDVAYLTSKGCRVQQFYGNNNEYSRMDCLVFNGNGAWIDTGEYVLRNRKGGMTFSYIEVAAEKWVGGAYGSPRGFGIGTANGTSFRTGEGKSFSPGTSITIGTIYTCTWNASSYYCTNVTLPIGGVYWQGIGGFSKSKIYGLYMYETDEVTYVLNLIPVVHRETGEVGMLNLVNNTFLGNAGAAGTYMSEGGPYQWTYDIYGEKLTFLPEPTPKYMGAFCNATSLGRVIIPPSVKKIGRYAFRNTNISQVVIASDCVYYDTSFPEGCTVQFYS